MQVIAFYFDISISFFFYSKLFSNDQFVAQDSHFKVEPIKSINGMINFYLRKDRRKHDCPVKPVKDEITQSNGKKIA